MPDAERFGEFRKTGENALHCVAVIKLNGGLGTGMGLEKAKSLLDVRDDLTFLDMVARQVLAIRSRSGSNVPLILMNSPHTAADSEEVLSRYSELAHPHLPGGFLQNRIPKIFASNLAAAGRADDELAWCPPGHGDLYTAIAGSGLLEGLLDQGFEYAFISNVDNLGAVLDPVILGYMVAHDHDFMMEAADRSAADRKGGHLCTSEGRAPRPPRDRPVPPCRRSSLPGHLPPPLLQHQQPLVAPAHPGGSSRSQQRLSPPRHDRQP